MNRPPCGDNPVSLKEEAIIGRGMTAHVFQADRDQLVFKLYRKAPGDPTGRAVTALCQAELEAYRRAAAHSVLYKHVPRCHGLQPVTDVLDGNGNSIAGKYELGACIALDRARGTEHFFGEIPDFHRRNFEALCDVFYDAGIRTIADGSFYYEDDPLSFLVVDIATRDVIAEWPEAWQSTETSPLGQGI